MVVKAQGHYVYLSHKPIPEQYLTPHNPQHVTYNLHGHFHNNEHRSLEYDDARHGYNRTHHLRLAVELTGYQALPLEYVVQHANKFKLGKVD